eukprot:7128168-Prymnesium_polylepis.1
MGPVWAPKSRKCNRSDHTLSSSSSSRLRLRAYYSVLLATRRRRCRLTPSTCLHGVVAGRRVAVVVELDIARRRLLRRSRCA